MTNLKAFFGTLKNAAHMADSPQQHAGKALASILSCKTFKAAGKRN